MGETGIIWWLQNKINRYAYTIGQIEGILDFAKGDNEDQKALVRHIRQVIEDLRKEQKKIDDEQQQVA